MNFYAISALVNAFTSLILGGFVFATNRYESKHRSFAYFALAVGLWSYAYFLWQIASSEATALFWSRGLMAAAIFIPVTYLHFVLSFLNIRKTNRNFLYFSYIFFFVFFLFNFTSLFVESVQPVLSFAYWPKPGPVYHAFLVVWLLYIVYTTWILFGRYKQVTGSKRAQVGYVLLGMVVGYIGGVTNYFLWYGIPVLPVGNIFVSFYVATTAYAIVKHRLMNIKVFTTEFLVILILAVLAAEIVLANNLKEVAFRALFFIFVALLCVWLVQSVFKEIYQREELAKLSKQLEISNEQLKKLDEAKSDFVSIASHQLRTPLTIIKGYISMLEEGSFGKIPPKQQAPLDKVFESANRLIELVENLLSVSRIESGRMKYNFEPTKLDELAKTVVEELSEAAKNKKLRLTYVKSDKDIPELKLDAEKLRQVMMNLVDNAIKYTKKGAIGVSVSIQDKVKGHIDKPSLVFAVKDTGGGVSLEDQHRLFQKFNRGQGSKLVHTRGTGLGLYVGRMMIEAHKGTIWVESRGEGQGSTFAFAIPLPSRGDKAVLALEEMLG